MTSGLSYELLAAVSSQQSLPLCGPVAATFLVLSNHALFKILPALFYAFFKETKLLMYYSAINFDQDRQDAPTDIPDPELDFPFSHLKTLM